MKQLLLSSGGSLLANMWAAITREFERNEHVASSCYALPGLSLCPAFFILFKKKKNFPLCLSFICAFHVSSKSFYLVRFASTCSFINRCQENGVDWLALIEGFQRGDSSNWIFISDGSRFNSIIGIEFIYGLRIGEIEFDDSSLIYEICNFSVCCSELNMFFHRFKHKLCVISCWRGILFYRYDCNITLIN